MSPARRLCCRRKDELRESQTRIYQLSPLTPQLIREPQRGKRESPGQARAPPRETDLREELLALQVQHRTRPLSPRTNITTAPGPSRQRLDCVQLAAAFTAAPVNIVLAPGRFLIYVTPMASAPQFNRTVSAMPANASPPPRDNYELTVGPASCERTPNSNFVFRTLTLSHYYRCQLSL